MKTIGALIVILSVLAGCDGGPDMAMPSDDAQTDTKADMKTDGGGGNTCTIFYNKDGYSDPCNPSMASPYAEKVCQSPEISESVTIRKPVDPKNLDGKMTGVCSLECVLYDGSGRTFKVGQDCGNPGLVCKLVINGNNAKHPVCMGN